MIINSGMKKVLSVFLSILIISNETPFAFADNNIYSEFGKKGMQYTEEGAKYLWGKYQYAKVLKERDTYKGFKPLSESKLFLDKIVEGKSDEKIYGQHLAKSQVLPIVKKSIHNIESMNSGIASKFGIEGNIIYMIGPSGVGKTTMAKAISKSILKNPDKTMLVINTGAIDGEVPLATQLFKTIEKKNIGFENRKATDFNGSIYTVEVEGAILDHILRWNEAVVIIDDYDKMKKMTLKESNMNGFYMNSEIGSDDVVREDRTADEILKSIAETGKYRVSNVEIDCSKILFIITTNETKEELEKNFGIDGAKGGGIQRINVIEFKDLTLDDCRKIIDEIIISVKEEITHSKGSFKVLDFRIDNDSKEKLARFIYNDKKNQGRLKRIIRNEIISLFTENIGDEEGKVFNIIYEESDEYGKLGKFKKVIFEDKSECKESKECFDGIDVSNVNSNVELFEETEKLIRRCNDVIYYHNKCCRDATSAVIFYNNFLCKEKSYVYDILDKYFTKKTVDILNRHKNLQSIVEFVVVTTKNKNNFENETIRKSFAENLLKQVLKNLYQELANEKWKNSDIVKLMFVNNKVSVKFDEASHDSEESFDEFIHGLNHLKRIFNGVKDKDKMFNSLRLDVYKLLTEL